MATPVLDRKPSVSRAPIPPAEPDILPSLFGAGYGTYEVRPRNYIFSFLAHIVLVALAIAITTWIANHHQQIKQQIVGVVTDISPYILPASVKPAGGGGGGGDRDKLAASKGALPKASAQQITPPTVVRRNFDPKLAVAPTVVAPDVKLPQLSQMGDPMAALALPPSNGMGSSSGIGTGSSSGVGSGRGPGFGPGTGGGFGGGAYRVGGGVSAPRAVYSPDPEYSEEARKAKYQGTVVLWVVVGPDGRVHDLKVQRSLGLGLDEKALEAVRTWKFDPARKDGQAVAVQLNIEVSFRLY
jgi:periplasmic protein TonB